MDFCRGYNPATFVGIRAVGLHTGQTGHGFGLLGDDRHLDHTVLQGLKRTDRHPELLAGLEVFKRGVIRKLQGSNRFGADQGGCIVHHGFDQRQGLSFRADQRISGNNRSGEMHIRGA